MLDPPLLLFAYNRPDHLRRTLNSLQACKGVRDTDVWLIVDGPASSQDEQALQQIRNLSNVSFQFRSFRTVFLKDHMGLSRSIRTGVCEGLEEHEAVMVLEDDLEVSPWFLNYLRTCLSRFGKQEAILSVSSYLPPAWRLGFRGKRPDIWLCTRPMSWGWGTWRSAWISVDWERAEREGFDRDVALQAAFGEACGADLPGMLRGVLANRLDSWAVPFAYEHWRRNAKTVMPAHSYTRPTGFDGSGKNCQWNPLRWLETVQHALPAVSDAGPIAPCPEFERALVRFYDRHHRWVGRWIE
jgi:glycosyltransferase involved in cell wall biosynthesis